MLEYWMIIYLYIWVKESGHSFSWLFIFKSSYLLCATEIECLITITYNYCEEHRTIIASRISAHLIRFIELAHCYAFKFKLRQEKWMLGWVLQSEYPALFIFINHYKFFNTLSKLDILGKLILESKNPNWKIK